MPQVSLHTPHCPVSHVYLVQPVGGEELGHRLQVCLQFALHIVHSTSAASIAGQSVDCAVIKGCLLVLDISA